MQTMHATQVVSSRYEISCAKVPDFEAVMYIQNSCPTVKCSDRGMKVGIEMHVAQNTVN